MRHAPTALLCLLALAVPVPTHADTLDADAILERSRAAAAAGGNLSAAFSLEVHAPGWSAERNGRIYKERESDGRKTLIVFDDPAQLRGIKILSQQPVAGQAQQWLYVPAAHRARRIAPGDTGRSILGGDFTASDLEQRGPGRAARLRGREERGGAATWVIALAGDDGGTPSEEVVWIRADDFRLVRREFYTNGALNRIYVADVLEPVDGIPTPVIMTLVNVANGTRSRIRLSDVRYGLRFDPALFALQYLDSRLASLAAPVSAPADP